MDIQNINEDLLLDIDNYTDLRGNLSVLSLKKDGVLPFKVDRVFWLTRVPAEAQRGKHAHRTCWEILIPVHGEFKVKVDDGKGHCGEFKLCNPNKGLLIPPLVWCELFDFVSDAVCLCLASGDYDKEGYVSDFNQFLNLVKNVE